MIIKRCFFCFILSPPVSRHLFTKKPDLPFMLLCNAIQCAGFSGFQQIYYIVDASFIVQFE